MMRQPTTKLLSILTYLLTTTTYTASAYSFVGKRALVTGSSGRVGAAIAKELARRGASVLVHYNTKYDSAKLTNQHILESATHQNMNAMNMNNPNLVPHGTCDGIIQCDFNKPGDILQMMRIVDQIWGGQLDILINSAECVTRLASEDDNDRINSWRRTVQVNLNAPFKLSKLAHKRMKQQPDGGVIVNISSNHASKNLEYMTAYAASKAGLDRMTAGLSSEWSRDKVRVNAVAPTFSLGSERFVESNGRMTSSSSSTDSWSTQSSQSNGSTSSSPSSSNKTVRGKVATIENIVNSALYLCESEFTTGSVLTVDGSNARTNMFRPRPLNGSTTAAAATRPRPNSSDSEFSRYDQPNRPNSQQQYGPYNRSSAYANGYNRYGNAYNRAQSYPSSQGTNYRQNQNYMNPRASNITPYVNQRYSRGTSFDDNGSTPQRKMMENYRDGTERFNDYQQVARHNRVGGQNWDNNNLARRRMENYRDGSELYQNRNMPAQHRDYEPRHYATRPKKRDGQTYSSTRSVSQNFTNGTNGSNDSRFNRNNEYIGTPLFGTRPPPRERVRREMNAISKTLYNGESSLPEYATYPDPYRSTGGYSNKPRYTPPDNRDLPSNNPRYTQTDRDLPKLLATRPRPDQKYKQVTRYLNGEPPKPLVDTTKERNPIAGNYKRLSDYDDEPKRYGGTSQPL